MDQSGIFDPLESADFRNDSAHLYRAPEVSNLPMGRLQAWAGMAASLANRLEYIPAQHAHFARG